MTTRPRTSTVTHLAGRTAQILKFWLVDLWGRDWDWHRRGLLLKHFWAYFRNPPIPGEHLPGTLSRPASEEQRAFSAAYLKKIDWVQGAAAKSRGVFLTYRPLGKNLRLLGTAIRENVDRRRRVFIEPQGPPTERRALASRGHEWTPWVWVRSRDGAPEGAASAARAWNELFRNPSAVPGAEPTGAPKAELPRLKLADGSFSPRYLKRVLKVAAATRYVFSPSEPIMARIERLKEAAHWPPPDRPVLGIHVRRGDAASAETAEAAPGRSTRRSFALTTYLETADTICARYGIRDIFMATESRDEIERAMRLRPQYRFLWIDYDRSILPDISISNRFIEDLALEHPERAKALAVTAILDLYFFCECHAFIGTFNSEFSVLAWLLTIGSRGHLVPYVSLSKAAAGRSLEVLIDRVDPFAALLNRNQCPLELHHW